MIYGFDPFELDVDRFELRRDGEPVRLEPQVLMLIRLLVENAGRLVTKDEIIAEIWQSKAVSDAAISSRISSARSALGDDGKSQRYIRTVHGKGLVFDVAVTKIPAVGTQDAGPPAPARRRRLGPIAALGTVFAAGFLLALWAFLGPPKADLASLDRMAFPLPDKPSVAVLPFVDLSPGQSPNLIADALTTDIIADLSRFRDFFVISASSTFTYKGQPVKVQQVAEDLGVRYVLEGSLQASGQNVEVSTLLVDALTGRHVWSEQYRVETADTFALQDEITSQIVASIGGQDGRIARNDLRLAKRKGTDNLSAYENVLLGIELRHQFTPEKNRIAEAYCQRAADLDPEFAQAHICLGFIHYLDRLYGWTDDPKTSTALGFQFARKAVQLDPLDEEAHWILANMYWVSGQNAHAVTAYRRAMEINPSNADILAEWGWNMVFLTGEAETAVANIERAMRLNPFHDDWYEQGLGMAAYAAKDFEKAVAALDLVRFHAIDSRVAYAASLAQLGRDAEAARQVEHIRTLEPDFTVEKWLRRQSIVQEATAAHFRDGLEKAGLGA